MALFQPAYELVLQLEGGYSKDDDNGRGSVNRGITELTLRELRSQDRWKDLPEDPKMLTADQARRIYHDHYWVRSKAEGIADQRLANAYFATFINMWLGATELLQEAVGVEPDRRFGPKTLAAVNGAAPNLVLESFKRWVLRHYEFLATTYPDQYADDLTGWINRLKLL